MTKDQIKQLNGLGFKYYTQTVYELKTEHEQGVLRCILIDSTDPTCLHHYCATSHSHILFGEHLLACLSLLATRVNLELMYLLPVVGLNYFSHCYCSLYAL